MKNKLPEISHNQVTPEDDLPLSLQVGVNCLTLED